MLAPPGNLVGAWRLLFKERLFGRVDYRKFALVVKEYAPAVDPRMSRKTRRQCVGLAQGCLGYCLISFFQKSQSSHIFEYVIKFISTVTE